MAKRISVRLPEGHYEAAKEIAGALDIDKSSAAGIVFAIGLQGVNREFFAERTRLLMDADTMAASSDFLRMWADATPEAKAAFEEKFGEWLKRALEIFGGALQ